MMQGSVRVNWRCMAVVNGLMNPVGGAVKNKECVFSVIHAETKYIIVVSLLRCMLFKKFQH